MRDPFWTSFFVIITVFICFFICLWGLIKVMYEDFVRFENQRRRENRIIPIHTLIQIAQERHNRERYIIEIEQYNKVLSELKNKVIVINPDETISIGTKN